MIYLEKTQDTDGDNSKELPEPRCFYMESINPESFGISYESSSTKYEILNRRSPPELHNKVKPTAPGGQTAVME